MPSEQTGLYPEAHHSLPWPSRIVWLESQVLALHQDVKELRSQVEQLQKQLKATAIDPSRTSQ